MVSVCTTIIDLGWKCLQCFLCFSRLLGKLLRHLKKWPPQSTNKTIRKLIRFDFGNIFLLVEIVYTITGKKHMISLLVSLRVEKLINESLVPFLRSNHAQLLFFCQIPYYRVPRTTLRPTDIYVHFYYLLSRRWKNKPTFFTLAFN